MSLQTVVNFCHVLSGKIEKIIRFKNDIPYLKEYYKKNGKSICVDGNGKYVGLYYGYKQSISYKISGNIKDGKMEGKWVLSGPPIRVVEYFENGRYINEETNKSKPIISLTGFTLHENVGIFRFIAIPREYPNLSGKFRLPGTPVVTNSRYIESYVSFNTSDSNNNILKYKNSHYLNEGLSKELENHLLELCTQNKIHNFWSFIQFIVSDNDAITNLVVYSNNELITRSINQHLSKNKYFEAVKEDGKNKSCDVYLSIFFKNGKLFIPEYNFNNLFTTNTIK